MDQTEKQTTTMGEIRQLRADSAIALHEYMSRADFLTDIHDKIAKAEAALASEDRRIFLDLQKLYVVIKQKQADQDAVTAGKGKGASSR